ncbi:midas domain-containing protein [Bacillus niameyensis]|uniref:hypothetical protein n=1 Tax=Bacillus niameyensis TaxID=1522308 RepID=UPI0007806C76|nr:hypothetical protein [Bacillus niameyensis]
MKHRNKIVVFCSILMVGIFLILGMSFYEKKGHFHVAKKTKNRAVSNALMVNKQVDSEKMSKFIVDEEENKDLEDIEGGEDIPEMEDIEMTEIINSSNQTSNNWSNNWSSTTGREESNVPKDNITTPSSKPSSPSKDKQENVINKPAEKDENKGDQDKGSGVIDVPSEEKPDKETKPPAEQPDKNENDQEQDSANEEKPVEPPGENEEEDVQTELETPVDPGVEESPDSSHETEQGVTDNNQSETQ